MGPRQYDLFRIRTKSVKGVPMDRELYLIRHGETLFNVQHKTQGWCDSPLTERGIEQCRIAGKTLAARGLTFDSFYSSTSERCSDTLELVMEAAWGQVFPYERRKGLKEHNFGAFEAKDQFLEIFPHGDFYANYGGETEDEALSRYISAVDAMMAESTGRVLACTHGGVNIMLFRALMEGREVGQQPFGNCVCYHYLYDMDKRGLDALTWVETFAPDDRLLAEAGIAPQVAWVKGS